MNSHVVYAHVKNHVDLYTLVLTFGFLGDYDFLLLYSENKKKCFMKSLTFLVEFMKLDTSDIYISTT